MFPLDRCFLAWVICAVVCAVYPGSVLGNYALFLFCVGCVVPMCSGLRSLRFVLFCLYSVFATLREAAPGRTLRRHLELCSLFCALCSVLCSAFCDMSSVIYAVCALFCGLCSIPLHAFGARRFYYTSLLFPSIGSAYPTSLVVFRPRPNRKVLSTIQCLTSLPLFKSVHLSSRLFAGRG